MLFAAASGKALSSIWHRTNFASIANPVHVSPLPTRFRGGGGGNKTEGGGGVGKKRKRSSWITPSACNQRTGNVQRRFIKPIWVFRFRFDLPHRDLCPMLAASTILSLLEKKKTLHRHVHSPPFELIAFQLATSARDFGFFAVEIIFPSFSLFLSRFPLVCGLKRK